MSKSKYVKNVLKSIVSHRVERVTGGYATVRVKQSDLTSKQYISGVQNVLLFFFCFFFLFFFVCYWCVSFMFCSVNSCLKLQLHVPDLHTFWSLYGQRIRKVQLIEIKNYSFNTLDKDKKLLAAIMLIYGLF
jgi:hypothetical protein